MVITSELRAQILRPYHAVHWRVGAIARQLRLHLDAVRRILAIASVLRALLSVSPRLIHPFMPFAKETLARLLYATVLESGYACSNSHCRHFLPPLRPPGSAAKAYSHLQTLAANQARVNWAHRWYFIVGRPSVP